MGVAGVVVVVFDRIPDRTISPDLPVDQREIYNNNNSKNSRKRTTKIRTTKIMPPMRMSATTITTTTSNNSRRIRRTNRRINSRRINPLKWESEETFSTKRSWRKILMKVSRMNDQ